MKTISRLLLCLSVSALLFISNVASASKIVASGMYKVKTIVRVSETNISPYFPLKSMIVTQCYVGYQVMTAYPGPNNYYIAVRYGQADNNGPVYIANAPVDIAVTGNISSTYFSGSVTGTILAGNSEWASSNLYSTYVPLVTITSTSPGSISGIPITIIN